MKDWIIKRLGGYTPEEMADMESELEAAQSLTNYWVEIAEVARRDRRDTFESLKEAINKVIAGQPEWFRGREVVGDAGLTLRMAKSASDVRDMKKIRKIL